MIIAIVVEAWIGVAQDLNRLTHRLLQKNRGSFVRQMTQEIVHLLYLLYFVLLALLFPPAFHRERKRIFVRWTDAEWMKILEAVVQSRIERGASCQSCTMNSLAKDIKQLDVHSYQGFLQRILSSDGNGLSLIVETLRYSVDKKSCFASLGD